MALDEALLVTSGQPVLRFYQWSAPEITIGFFIPLASVRNRPEPVTRRWTGGGIVEHGDDLTYSLVLPRREKESRLTATETHRRIHVALSSALRLAGLETEAAVVSNGESAPGGGFCFSSPVTWDVVCRDNGEKLAGGAQRRTREGLLHQGSVRLPRPWNSLNHAWIEDFARLLSGGAAPDSLPGKAIDGALAVAARLESDRYASPEWLSRR